MKRFLSSGALVAFTSSFFAFVACSSSSSSDPPSSERPPPSPTSTDVPSTPSRGDVDASTPGKVDPADNNAPSCKAPEDCPYWYCECESGPPLNTRHCTNGRCEDGRQACPTSCKSFKTCWTGRAKGGWDGGSNAGPNECNPPIPPEAGTGCGDATSFTDIGKACAGNAQCQSGQCWGVSPSFLCTKRCTTASQCPANWKCVKNGDGFDICMQGNVGATGSPSTNTGCGQVAFTDLGMRCTTPTNCQSSICLGSSYCSRRCEASADCPAGWSCTTGATFKYCTR